MEPENLERFVLKTGELYLDRPRASIVLWVGSAEDLIADYQSRSRFRLAMDCADRVFRVEATADEVERADHGLGPRRRRAAGGAVRGLDCPSPRLGISRERSSHAPLPNRPHG